MLSTPLIKCLCCGGPLDELMDFGSMPLVNTYSATQKMPLAVNRCLDCCHLQLSEAVDPAVLYSDYAYCSGTGRTASDFFKSFARTALSYYPAASSVLDIASNDGSQLDAFAELGLSTCGVDPAENLATIAAEKGHDIRISLFEDAKFPEGKTFDLLTAQNVVAHTSRPLKFLQRCRSLMHSDSRLFIATSQANMVINGECDTIYHEHISYFNLGSMRALALNAGLKVLDVLMEPIHGTSYVFVLGLDGEPSTRVRHRALWEHTVGINGDRLYEWWSAHVREKIYNVKHRIEAYREDGYTIIGLGAAAKGISMLNMAMVKLDSIMDSTPTKWGKETSGMKILPFDTIGSLAHEKVLFVVLAWNVGAEIRSNAERLRNQPQDVFIEIR